MSYNNTAAQLVDGVPTTIFPVDHNLISWAYDPIHATNTYTLATSGTVYVTQVKLNKALITNIVLNVTTAGATLTSGQNFAGIYQNGTLLGTTADQSTAWASTGVVTAALATPVYVSQGLIYVAVVSNGTTKPTFASASAAAGINAGLSAGSYRFASANTSVTTALPTTLGTQTALAASPWVAVS